MNSLQTLVADFNKKNIRHLTPAVRCLDLASEVGEVSKLAFLENLGKKVTSEEWQEELGDTLYCLLSLMSELDLNAELALQKALFKYEKRMSKKGSMDSGTLY